MKHMQKKFKNCPTQGMRQKHIRTEFMSLCPNKRGSYVLISHQARELCSYVLMSKKEKPSMNIRSFFQNCPTQGIRQKNRIYILMSHQARELCSYV